jgi:uncharacterized protein (TIGR02147 family)
MLMNPPIEDFRLYLQHELIRRCQANPQYSLRAFARFLDIEPSFLSKLISGKKKITRKTVEKLSGPLGLNPEEKIKFSKVFSQESEVAQFKNLALDHFQVIADWYHYAILELVSTKGFKLDNHWIAKRLGISVNEANAAIERLIRLEFLEKNKKGQWVNKSGHNTTVGNEFTAVAFRKLQKQVLMMGVDALENISFEKRDQSSMTMAVDSKLLPFVKEHIKTFRRQLAAEIRKKSKNKNSVYQLGISFYPLTKTKEEE